MPFPRTLADIKVVQQALHDYQSRHYGHVLAVGAAAYVYKQSFALPGSGAMNVLLGAIFGLWLGFPAACLLTAIGSSFAFLISAYVLEPIVLRLFPIKIAQLKAAVAKDAGTDLLITMTGLRVFPLTPQWFVNMASPLIHVPLTTHFLSVLVGVAPYVLVFDDHNGFCASNKLYQSQTHHSYLWQLICSLHHADHFQRHTRITICLILRCEYTSDCVASNPGTILCASRQAPLLPS